MRIAVASGKGGTGKTLVATNLSFVLGQRGLGVTYVDADVEAPNGDLFLPVTDTRVQIATVPVPTLRSNRCAGHGACQEICAFNAILAVNGSIVVFSELCHSCGACVLACPDNALVEIARPIGEVIEGRSGGVRFLGGRLTIGESRAVPLIAAVLEQVAEMEAQDIVIVDAPPGVACSAVEVVKGADLVLLVTEPTPFGCHDLGLAIEMCRTLNLRVAAVVNRADIGDREVFHLLEKAGVPILAEIPFVEAIASAYAASELAVKNVDTFRETVVAMGEEIERQSRGFL